ncbi:MAG: AAA family ATPase [Proteobacteria bacterium]|nr:AAA family ATPase [Pseudomonadota bacterium]
MNEDKMLKPFGEIAESFKELKDEGIYYVDKTAIIPYLVTQKRKICVVTRPRRFGKTLMLRMLQTFFEYALDKDGKPVDNRHYFEGLKVMDAGEDVLKEMGQYPVISLSLKDMRNDTLDAMVIKLRSALASACSKHEYLLAHPALQDFEHEQFRDILSKRIEQSDLEDALRNLCEWLYKATNRKTVILLDEYDVPLQKAAIHDIHNPGDNLFDQTVSLVGNFISSGFKSNSNLAYGIIAGCMRVAKESIFTGMNNPGVITVVDEIPDEFWGFTEADVKQMLSYYGIEDKYEMLEKWYDGYEYSGRKVFNPVSLLNAIRGLVNGYGDKAIKSYWAMTSSNDIIDDMIDNNPQHREALARLMSGETMTVPVFDNLSYRDLKQNPDAIWSFLLYTGYLKAIKVGKDDDDLLMAEVAVPNNEILTVMKSSMQRWWKMVRLKSFNAQPLMDAMNASNIKEIERLINILLENGMSCFDYNEAFYNGTLYAVMLTQADSVKSNAEYGDGRPDLVVIFKDRAFVLELKRVSGTELEKAKSRNKDSSLDEWDIEDACMNDKLDEAERQIKERRYAKGVLREFAVVRDVTCYGIAFCKKRCAVRMVVGE